MIRTLESASYHRKKEMEATQRSYKRLFDKRVRIQKQAVTSVSQVFLREEYLGTTESHHKLALKVTGTYLVTATNDKMCVIEREDLIK